MIQRRSRWLGPRLETLLQFAGYVAVSGAALCVDVSVYWSLLAVSRYAFVAAAGGYLCGVLAHYLLSSRIVFRSSLQARGVAAEAPMLAKFYAAGFAGLLVTTLIVGLLADVLQLHPLLAKGASAACSFVVVFTTLRLFVFKPPLPTVSVSVPAPASASA